MKDREALYRYVTRNYYIVKYNQDLFKFGALFYMPDLGYIGTQEESFGWTIKILNDSTIAATCSGKPPILAYPSSKNGDTMLIPEWAYEILDPKPILAHDSTVELFHRESVDE